MVADPTLTPITRRITRRVGRRTPRAPWVQVARLLFPTLAVLVLAIAVAWPLIGGREMSFILSKDEVSVSDERLRMERPRYRGHDALGRAFEIRAARAVQRTSATPVVELTQIAAQIETRNGLATVTAHRGSYDLKAERLVVSGPITLDNGAGYQLSTGDAVLDLRTQRLAGVSGVAGSGPLGTFTARRFVLDIPHKVAVFEGGARMTLQPKRL